jgi:hypothetical protein
MGYKPVNKYLAPRARPTVAKPAADTKPITPSASEAGTAAARFFAWADKVLSR